MTPLRIGLLTPIVTLLPPREQTWEVQAGPEALREIALAADRLGFAHLTCSEHVGIPTQVAAVRGGRYYDPLATLAWFAALTTRVRLLTHVLVLPYHHPLALAKRYGTLDRLSGGRLILGVGVGTLREEFELLGVEFERRGERYADALRALRAAFAGERPVYRGEHYRFDDFVVDPCAAQPRMPIWLGGRTPLSLRRALLHADGWDPFGLGLSEVSDLLARARDWPEWRERQTPFDVALMPGPRFDPTLPDERDALAGRVAHCRDAGATAIHLAFPSRSLSHYLDQLAAASALLAPSGA